MFDQQQADQVQLYFDATVERAKEFIEYKIWSGIDRASLDNWLAQFRTPEHKLTAATILRNLCYRSKAQTTALAKQIFQRKLPNLLQGTKYSHLQSDWLDILTDRSNSAHRRTKIRLVPVIKRGDRPTKSGPVVARLLKIQLGINDKFMIWPHEIQEQVTQGHAEIIIFLDDVIGSGKQFITFIRDFQIERIQGDTIWGYTPFATTENGKTSIEKKFPWLKVDAAEKIKIPTSVFDDPELKGISQDDVVSAYSLTVKDFLNCNSNLFWGYGKLSLTYAFEHATPNNNLPLIWKREESFEPLLRR